MKLLPPALSTLLLAALLLASTVPLVYAERSSEYGGPVDAGQSKLQRIETPEAAKQLRRPVALQLSADERFLYVACRRSGTLVVVDVPQRAVISETKIGEQLSDLVAVEGSSLMLATDEAAHELVLLQADAGKLEVLQRLDVPDYPVQLAVDSTTGRAYVASLWPRQLSGVRLDVADRTVSLEQTVDLEIAPRTLLLVEDQQRLIAADSFAGRLAVLDTTSMQLRGVRKVPAHNIRGLGVSANGRMLLVAHQMLNELAHTVRNDVHWGLLMSNDLRWLNLQSVLGGADDLYAGAHMHPLGEAGHATGDPAGLTVAADGTVVVTLGGVGEIAFGREQDFSLYRLPVGRRPTAVVTSADSCWAYVANTFDDSLSLVDLKQREVVAEISLGPMPELSLADRGELLFYDATLSHDGWMSCNSCHTDGHTNTLTNDNFSDGSFGAPKRVLSLLGRADTAPFGWKGNAADLPEQIRKSIRETMQSAHEPRQRDVEALTEFLATLPLPPSRERLRGVQDEAAVQRGRGVFVSQQCIRCHQPPTYTTPATYDVGLDDNRGNTLYNPPSLRGVSQRGPYFHDNRAESLEDVFQVHGHQLQGSLEEDELKDLISFLRSL